MQGILQQAWSGTLVSLGISRFSWRKGFRSVIVALVFIALVFGVRGHEAAMVEAWDIFWLAVALGCAFIATFLANVWLAPYKILTEQNARLNERLNEIEARQGEQENGAKAAPDARLERGQQEAQQRRKKQRALRDMDRLRTCIQQQMQTGGKDIHHTLAGSWIRDCEHHIPTLKNKYREWLPSECTEPALIGWISRIIATLKAHDYETAETLSKDAAAKGSWPDA